MSYSSNVGIAVSVYTEDLPKIKAAYMLNDDVLAADCISQWKEQTLGNVTMLTLETVNTVWVDSRDEVRGYEYLIQMLQDWRELTDQYEGRYEPVPFAYRFIRIGEDIDDLEITMDSYKDHSGSLRGTAYYAFGVSRELVRHDLLQE